jgi:NADH-quinone oxidoreductase subunit J
MLDVDFAALRSGFQEYLPVGALVALVLLLELALVIGVWTFGDTAIAARDAVAPRPEDVSNTAALGRILYTDYFLLFQLSGLVLLVAMIGAIMLTLRKRVGVRRQNVLAQMYRTRAQSVELQDVKPGRGI